jgi:hypothetical protein
MINIRYQKTMWLNYRSEIRKERCLGISQKVKRDVKTNEKIIYM